MPQSRRRRHPKSTAERGYGYEHQKLRAMWRPRVEAGGVVCWRCQNPILPWQRWDLGHSDTDRSRYAGPEHIGCNRATAGRARRRRVAAKVQQMLRRTSREW